MYKLVLVYDIMACLGQKNADQKNDIRVDTRASTGREECSERMPVGKGLEEAFRRHLVLSREDIEQIQGSKASMGERPML